MLLFGICSKAYCTPVESVEVKALAFFPSSGLFKTIYGHSGVEYQLEVATRLCLNGKNRFPLRGSSEKDQLCTRDELAYVSGQGWINFNWFPKSGQPMGMEGSTHLNRFCLNFGLRGALELASHWTISAGIGPSVGWIYISDTVNPAISMLQPLQSSCSKFGVGVVGQLRSVYAFNCNLFLSVVGEYLYLPVRFVQSVDVGGIKAGLGLGYRF